MISNRPSVVGFDLGNSHSVVAMARNARIETISTSTGSRAAPSVVAFHGKRRLYAAEAEAQEKGNVENTLWFMKRLIGRKLADPEVQEEARWLSQPLTEDADGRLQVEIDYGGEVLQLRPEEVVAMKLGQLRRTAQADMEGQICEDCVIACPGYWTDVQRRAFLQSARVANLNPVRLLNEGAAVALAYGMLRALPKDPIIVAFVDVGQTSTQLTLVEFCVDTIKVLASGAEPLVGGRNFTDLLVAACARQFKDKQKEDIYTSPKALLKLRLACEKAKTVLSANKITEVNCECLLNDKDLKVNVDRSEFEAMCQPLLERITAAIGKLFQNSGIQREALHSLEIVGGGTRIPCVQKVLGEAFSKPVSKTCDGSESVAKGCALMCAVLSPSFKVKEYKMRDANPYGVTLEWANEQGEPQSVELFGKFHAYPSLKELNLKASEKFSLVLRYTSLDALPPGTALPLGSWTVHGEELVERAKKDGVQKVKCSIRLDENGFVEVKGADLLESVEAVGDNKGSKKTTKKKIKRIPLIVEGAAVNQPHTEDIAVMKARDAQMTKEDDLCAERENLRNDIETCVLESRGALEEGGDLAEFVSPSDREALLASLERAEWWLDEQGQDADTPTFLAKKAELDALVGPPRELRKQAKLRADAVTDMVLALSASERDLDGVSEQVTATLLPQIASARGWLADQQELQKALAPSDPPVLTAKDILDKLEAFKASTGQAIKQAKAAISGVSGKDTKEPEKETASDEPMLQLEHAGAPETAPATAPETAPTAQAGLVPDSQAAPQEVAPPTGKKAKKASKKRSKKKSGKGEKSVPAPSVTAPPATAQPKPDPEALAKLAAKAASDAAQAKAKADDLSRQAAAAAVEAERLAKEAEDLALQAAEAKAQSVPVPSSNIDSDLD